MGRGGGGTLVYSTCCHHMEGSRCGNMGVGGNIKGDSKNLKLKEDF